MRIIVHLRGRKADFQTDKRGDLHIFEEGTQPDLTPLPRKRKRKGKASPAPTAREGIPYKEPPPPAPSKSDTDKLQEIVMDDKGWQ
jgi:hypothetical protein